MFCKTDTLGIYSRNGSVSTKSHTKYFCQAVHAVCSVHTGAGATGRTYFFFEFTYIVCGQFACRVFSDCLKHTGKAAFASLHMTCQHRAAAYKYGRHIDTCGCHQKPRYILVTVRYHDQGIELMCQCHCLGRICDQISCYQRIFHTDMTHGNTVADCDRREYYRCTACHGNTLFYCIDDFIQVHMTRNDFIIRTYDTN